MCENRDMAWVEELHRKAQLGERMQWIPVSERLPEDSKKVLAFIDEPGLAFYVRVHEFKIDLECLGDIPRVDIHEDKSFLKPGWYFETDDSYVKIKDGFVTHWMPLPEPPKEEHSDD